MASTGTVRRRPGIGWAAARLGAALAFAACGGAGGSDAGSVILLQNENNYRSTSQLVLPTVETAAASDLDICWTNATTDIQCHPLVPAADIDNVGFLRFLHLTQEQVETKLVSGELTQSQIDGYVEFRTDHVSTCTKLSQFSFFGTPIDVAAEYQENTDEIYMLLFAHGTQPGVGARVMTFVKPKATLNDTRVDAPAGCGLLDFTPDLTTPRKVVVSPTGPWQIDWRNVTQNGQGSAVIYATLDQLLIGFYQGMTVADLEAKFFDIEILATSLWDLSLAGGRTADLSQATERGTGAAFAGFGRTDGVWLLGLFCTTCQNPAPVVLTILEPTPGGR